tara:strand:- start:1687 stop:2178 length:492 start_codon:yes stop_codon:yes gene_type:complete
MEYRLELGTDFSNVVKDISGNTEISEDLIYDIVFEFLEKVFKGVNEGDDIVFLSHINVSVEDMKVSMRCMDVDGNEFAKITGHHIGDSEKEFLDKCISNPEFVKEVIIKISEIMGVEILTDVLDVSLDKVVDTGMEEASCLLNRELYSLYQDCLVMESLTKDV